MRGSSAPILKDMSRMISMGKRNRKVSLVVSAHERQESLRALRAAFLETHKHCLLIVSQSVSEDFPRNGENTPELMAMVLACAQISQSASTLIQIDSEHLLSFLASCIEICRSTAEACDVAGLEGCRAACLESAEKCSLFLNGPSMPL